MKQDKTPILYNSSSILSGLDQTSSFQPIHVHAIASDIEHHKELNDTLIESDINLKITGKALNLSRAKSLFSIFKTGNKNTRKKYQYKIDFLKSNCCMEKGRYVLLNHNPVMLDILIIIGINKRA